MLVTTHKLISWPMNGPQSTFWKIPLLEIPKSSVKLAPTQKSPMSLVLCTGKSAEIGVSSCWVRWVQGGKVQKVRDIKTGCPQGWEWWRKRMDVQLFMLLHLRLPGCPISHWLVSPAVHLCFSGAPCPSILESLSLLQSLESRALP